LENQKVELLKAQISIRVHGYGWARFNTAWQARRTRRGNDGGLARRVKQMFSDEKAEKAPPAVGAAGPRRGDEAPQNARGADDSGELLAREAPGKRGGDAGGGCSAANR